MLVTVSISDDDVSDDLLKASAMDPFNHLLSVFDADPPCCYQFLRGRFSETAMTMSAPLMMY